MSKYRLVEWPLVVAYVLPYRRGLLMGMALMMVASAISLVIPLFAGRFAELLLSAEPLVAVSTEALLVVLLFALALQSVLNYVSGLVLANTGESLLMNMRHRLYDHTQRLPLATLRTYNRGEILSLFTHDVPAFVGFMISTAVGLLPLALTFVGALFFMYRINSAVAVLAVIFLPVFFVAIKLVSRSIRPTSTALFDEMAASINLLEENVDMLPLIKSVNMEAEELAAYQRINERILHLHRHNTRLQLMLSPLVQFSGMAAIVLMLWLSVTAGGESPLTVADLVSLLLYGSMLAGPVGSLANVYGSYQSTSAATERISRFMAHTAEDLEAGRPLSITGGPMIQFQDVTFSYRPSEPVLTGLNLTIKAGETVVITGRNGAGKSTLIDLLLRFATPQGGRIMINDVDIGSLRLGDLRQHIGLVYQDARLFNRSIRENVLYGNRDVIADHSPPALRFMTFTKELGEGVETVVGERGDSLSGGQRQRVSLARVLVNAPPIIVFDEATSMLDPLGQSGWLDDCAALLRERTVIIVSHDPYLVKAADRVLRMQDGRLEAVDAGARSA